LELKSLNTKFYELAERILRYCRTATENCWFRGLFFEPIRGVRAWALYLASLWVIAAVMIILGWRMAPQIQPDPDASDQGAYAYLARSMQDAKWPHLTDGVRNPLFPWLVAKFVKPDFTEHHEIAAYLIPGKRFNAVLAVLIMMAIGIYAARLLPPVAAWNVAAVGGLGGLLPIAMFFGAEPLFYGLYFGVWVVGVRLLIRNPVWLYLLFAVLVGFTYLAKPSTTPFVLLLAGMSILRLLCNFLPQLPAGLRCRDWKPWRLAVGAVLFVLINGAIILPKAIYSAEHYDDPFYNAPKKWFWLVDWSDAYPKYQLVRKRDLVQMSADEQPTPANFIKRHGWDLAVWKLSQGTLTRLEQLFLPEQSLRRKVERRGEPRRLVLPFRGMYLVCALALAGVMLVFVLGRRRFRQVEGWMLPFLFIFGTFAAYTLAYGWFYGIGPGPRYIMSMYLPLLFFGMLAADRLRRVADFPLADVVFALALATPVFFLLPRIISLLANTRYERMLHAF